MAARPDQKIGEIRIGPRLLEAEAALERKRNRPIAAREICSSVRDDYGVPLSPSTYSLLRSDRRAPTVQQLIALSRVFDVTPEFLLGELGESGKDGVNWARRVPALSPSRTRFFTAFEALMTGRPLTEGLCRELGLDDINLDDVEGRESAEWEIGRLAQSAVFLGIAELIVTEKAVDHELSAKVREVLVSEPNFPEGLRTRLQVTVIRNPVHESFTDGGHVGPLLVGNYGLRTVGRFLETYPHASQLGLAGGFHVASLVRQVGFGELNWPERVYRLFPLTIEPFNKQIALGDVLVGGLTYRLGALLGKQRVHGYTLRAFGFLTDEGDVMLRQRSITTILDQLNEIDIAVLGVGDSFTPDGPLQRVLAMQGYKLSKPGNAVADVCLNPIDGDGQLLPKKNPASRIEQLIGIDTEQLRRMSFVEGQKLVLLLSSGSKKVWSTRAMVRGGFVNHVLCDSVLAEAIMRTADS